MQMSNKEIAGRYNRASEKKEQIRILSELNACPREDIIQILKDEGIAVEDMKSGRKSKVNSKEKNKEAGGSSADQCASVYRAAVSKDNKSAAVKEFETGLDAAVIENVPDAVKEAVMARMIYTQEQIDLWTERLSELQAFFKRCK